MANCPLCGRFRRARTWHPGTRRSLARRHRPGARADGSAAAACKRTLSRLFHFVWWRMIRWLRTLHRWTWTDVRRRFTTPEGRWKPITVERGRLVQPGLDTDHSVSLPGHHDPQPLDQRNHRL